MQRKATVLLLDDDLLPAQLYFQALSDEGFAVTFSSDVDEAIAVADNNMFDIAIVDLMLRPGRVFSDMETHAGYRTGLALPGGSDFSRRRLD